ncbi:phosphatidylinositol transfer protein 3-like [Cynara cardunculus var. scolymus]|uniref:phosphatidylinositol transfer protein 3-like n=1 Tax=Cynara cardunculus var. scolymus TaxID=59895 RepID=UPI000D626CF8|nr:phosphatidylinositol transfer protein 3-like [Cynara cardunculus var. scolymus]
MNPQLRKTNSNVSVTLQDQPKLISEVRKAIEKHKSIEKIKQRLGDEYTRFCSDESISRYLRARNWNIKKAEKMLEASLVWRMNYKPEEIRWEHIAAEAETGKIYRSSFMDKHGRTVLVMRPRCQNSKSTRAQIKYLVYCMENAILNLPPEQEQMVWLIDFHGFSMSNISIKSTKETAHILQDHYPERLGLAILYDPPKFFEPFWKVVKPFLEPKTANKVKFVYADDANTKNVMESLFYMDKLESAFGGKNEAKFDLKIYADRMKEDDAKRLALYKGASSSGTTSGRASTVSLDFSIANTDSDSDGEKKTPTEINEEAILAEAQKIAAADGGGRGARIEA